MSDAPVLPNVAASPETHADWLELSSFGAAEGRIAWTTYERDLRVGGTADGFDENQWEDSELLSESLEQLVTDVVAELTDRFVGCGGYSNRYPFEIGRDAIKNMAAKTGAVYRFLLLLSLFGKDAGPPGTHGDRLFEDVCAEALRAYLGNHEERASQFVFGFPRRLEPAHFPDALDELCRRMGEGGGHRARPTMDAQKDAKLDIVGWSSFPDRKGGQLIAFGQCATGRNWDNKLQDLQPLPWCQKWMRDFPIVLPLRTFFMPHRIERAVWDQVGIDAGVLFDRCRISWLVPEPSEELRLQLSGWSDHVLEEKELQ